MLSIAVATRINVRLGQPRKEHYGREYSTITCAHALQACEELGYGTLWFCRKTNLASAAVAQKLGYTQKRVFGGALYRATKGPDDAHS